MGILATPKASMPRARGLPLIGNLVALLRAGGAPYLHRYIDNNHKTYGAIFSETLGGTNAVFIANPEAMRSVFAHEGRRPAHVLPEAWTLYNQLYGSARGLFFMSGDEWLHHRRTMNNILLKPKPTDHIWESITTAGSFLDIAKWEANLEEALYKWSLDTIVAVMLGKERYLECKPSIDVRISEVSGKIKLIFETSSKLQIKPVKLSHKLSLPIWREFVDAVDDALEATSNFVYELITLSRPSSNNKLTNTKGVIQLMEDAETAPSDLIKIVVDLVLAAGDTTAYTMQWMLYLLAKHPKYQLDLQPHQIKNILKETLRLYPVAPFLTRINVEHEMLINNYYIPRNTLLIYSLYTVGRDGGIFNCPLKFAPERWENKTALMQQASLPFAMGARSCIGKRIAELQLTTMAVNLLNSYSVHLKNPEHQVEMILKMVSVPSTNIQLEFVKK